MLNRQLELGLPERLAVRPSVHNGRRVTRSRWWFNQMRQAVDYARDWPPASITPSEPGPGQLKQR
jgi:hypothetical protein